MASRLITMRHGLAGVFMALAGLFGTAILLLLCFNVAARSSGFNIVWVSETSRVLFVWGAAVGMVSVSLAGTHFRVDLSGALRENADDDNSVWELILQLAAGAVLAFIAWYAAPTIARAATQQMSSIPLSYGSLRAALVFALSAMCIAHVWRACEIALARVTPAASRKKDRDDV